MNAIVQQSPVETAARSPLALVPLTVLPTAPEKTDAHPVTATLNLSANGPAKSNPVWVAPKQAKVAEHKPGTFTELKFANLAEAVWFFLPEFYADNQGHKTTREIADRINYPNPASNSLCAKVASILASFQERGLAQRTPSNPFGYYRAADQAYRTRCQRSIRYTPYVVQFPPVGLGKTTEYLSPATEQAIASAADSAQELLPFGSTESMPRVIDAGPVASKRAPKDTSQKVRLVATAESMTRNFVVELLKSGTIHRRDLRALHEQLKEIFE